MSKKLTVNELARSLRLSPWSIRQAVKAGRLPCLRLHERGKIVFDSQEVEQVLRRPVAVAG